MRPSSRRQDTSSQRQVNNILHTLRGEQYRHTQNLQGLRANRARTSSYSHNSPTLPLDQIYESERPAEQSERERNTRYRAPPVRIGPEGVLEHAYPRGEVPGPHPPRSWSSLFGKGKKADVDEPTRRAQALSLMYSHLPCSNGSDSRGTRPVQPLTLLCLRVLFGSYTGPAFGEELVPHLPPHLRRDLLRWTAVHSPMSSAKLHALCEPDGHADGEFIVVGPQASLQRDFLSAGKFRPDIDADDLDGGAGSRKQGEGEDWSWDSPAAYAYTPPPLHALVLLSAAVPTATLFAFPPTLTHVALLALPAPAQIYRLPQICPLVEVLDLSFNPWLGESPGTRGGEVLDRMEWSRWGHLRVLGLRDCGINADIRRHVNKGRWSDVAIIGVML